MMFLYTLPQSGDLALSTLDLGAVEQEWGVARRDRSVDDRPLTLAGKAYASGIGTHANSSFEIGLDGNASRFRVTVGVDDETNGNGTVRFLVVADGKTLFDSKTMRKGDARTVDVDLTGVRLLRLVAEDAGDGIDNDHADWADASLTLNDLSKKPRTNAAAQEPTMEIAPVDRLSTAIHGAKSVGGTPGKPFLFRVPVTGPGPLRFTYKGLPQGVRAEENVLRGTVPPAGRYPIAVTVSGPKGKATRTITLVSGTNKLAQTPPMGWNSWNVWGTAVDADKVRAAADAFVSLGLADHGYAYVNIDDAWEAGRAADGEIETNAKFGDLPTMATYVHGLGLKLGIYSSPGPKTCGNYTGSWQHEAQDAATYAKWGIDYLKYDWCSYSGISKGDTLAELQKPYRLMKAGLDAAPRDIVLSMCQYGMGDVWEWGDEAGGDLWRTTGDITDTWGSMSRIGFAHSDRGAKVGPSAWNDPDMLVVGRLGWGPSLHPTRLSGNEQITHITLWSMLAAPLLIGCDLTQMDDFTQRLLMNDDVIDVDQDTLGKAARRVFKDDAREVWVRPLEGGAYAVALFNRGASKTAVRTDWRRDLGLTKTPKVRDLWRRKDLGRRKSGFAVDVPAHGATLLRVEI